MRGGLAGFMALVLLLIAAPALASKDRLVIGITEFPADMHPQITNTVVKNYILGFALRPLWRFNGQGEAECTLCTEMPTLANGRVTLVARPDGTQGMDLRITLIPGLAWGDGALMTSKDVAFGAEVEAAFTKPVALESVEVVDDRNFILHLFRVRFDYYQAIPQPLSEHVEGPIFRANPNPVKYGQKSTFNRNPEAPGLWNGPYRIVSFAPNDQVELEPNASWAGTKPQIPKFAIRFIGNAAALNANLLSGDVDVVGSTGLSLDLVLQLEKTQSARFNITFTPAVTTYSKLNVQLDNPLLADKRVRWAISEAIDRQTIIKKLYGGRVEEATSILHPAIFGWDATVKTWRYDPQASRRLLAEAGFRPGPDGILISPKGERFSIEVNSVSGFAINDLIEQVMQTELKAVGIELTIANQPSRLLFGETTRKRLWKGIVFSSWTRALNIVPLEFYSAQITSAENGWSGVNYQGFRNAAYDAALDRALAALDPAQRRRQWKIMLDILADELPQIPLFHPTNTFVAPKWLAGARTDKVFGGAAPVEEWRAE